MKWLLVVSIAALVSGSRLDSSAAAAERKNQDLTPTAPTSGLSELEALTFSCPKAALNSAARKAADVPSQGTYQFSYFAIVNDSHHAMYEVHFTSNYAGEPELKYCVTMYCQQGWDPKTAKTEVTLMSNNRAPAAGATHGGACHVMTTPAKRAKE